MAYESTVPTKSKKRLYGFMERHKRQGTISGKKLMKYAQKEGYTFQKGPWDKDSFYVINKQRTILMTATSKKKRINWWNIN